MDSPLLSVHPSAPISHFDKKMHKHLATHKSSQDLKVPVSRIYLRNNSAIAAEQEHSQDFTLDSATLLKACNLLTKDTYKTNAVPTARGIRSLL